MNDAFHNEEYSYLGDLQRVRSDASFNNWQNLEKWPYQERLLT